MTVAGVVATAASFGPRALAQSESPEAAAGTTIARSAPVELAPVSVTANKRPERLE